MKNKHIEKGRRGKYNIAASSICVIQTKVTFTLMFLMASFRYILHNDRESHSKHVTFVTGSRLDSSHAMYNTLKCTNKQKDESKITVSSSNQSLNTEKSVHL